MAKEKFNNQLIKATIGSLKKMEGYEELPREFGKVFEEYVKLQVEKGNRYETEMAKPHVRTIIPGADRYLVGELEDFVETYKQDLLEMKAVNNEIKKEINQEINEKSYDQLWVDKFKSYIKDGKELNIGDISREIKQEVEAVFSEIKQEIAEEKARVPRLFEELKENFPDLSENNLQKLAEDVIRDDDKNKEDKCISHVIRCYVWKIGDKYQEHKDEIIEASLAHMERTNLADFSLNDMTGIRDNVKSFLTELSKITGERFALISQENRISPASIVELKEESRLNKNADIENHNPNIQRNKSKDARTRIV